MELEKNHEQLIKEFDEKIKYAQDNDGEIEIRDALLAKALYFFE